MPGARGLGWLGLGVAVGATAAIAAPAFAQVRTFDLDPQDAATGIPAFAVQAGRQILVTEAAARGRRTAAVKGSLPVQVALARLLAGSGLSVAADDGRTIALVVEKIAPPPRPVAPDPEIPLQEVVVTALRREELAQQSPVSIRALGGQALRASGHQDYRDYLAAIPGVNYSEAGLRSIRITVRGVADANSAGDPLTGVYIDESPITETFAAMLDPDIYDVERVEVLKGPQGTLYGSGSMGGTVRIITRKPKLDAFEASGETALSSFAHGGVNARVDAMANLPLSPGVASLRVSTGYRRDSGWIDNLATGERGLNTVEKRNIRGQVLLRPSADATVILGVLHQAEDLGGPFYEDLRLAPYETARAYRERGAQRATLYSLTAEAALGWASVLSASNYLSKATVVQNDNSAALRVQVQRLVGVTVGDNEGLGVHSGNQFHLFTQELRLTSPGQGALDWVAGGFFSRGVTKATTVFDFSQSPSLAQRVSGSAFYDADQVYRSRQAAIFGEVTLKATERLSLTAGLRVFDVRQNNRLAGAGLLNGGDTWLRQHASGASKTRKYLLKYAANPNSMVYAQAAEGYRNGGATGGFPTSACADDLAAVGLTSVPDAFGPDKLWNYELGSKNTLANGRLVLNGAVYRIDWRHMQTGVSLSCGFGLTINGGKAVSQGAEFETVLTPVRGLTLTGAFSYLDATLRQTIAGAPGRAGDRLPYVSKWSWNLSAQYRWGLGGDLRGVVRAELNHVGDRWSGFAGQANRARLLDPYTALNMRLGVSHGPWSLSLYGANLTDAHVANATSGANYRVVGAPRLIGVELGAAF